MANGTTRRALGLSTLLAPLGAAAAVSAPASSASPEIRRLWANLVAARAAFVELEAADPHYREQLVARWGEIPRGSSANEHWGHDPDHARFCAWNEEIDRLSEIDYDSFEALLECPSQSVADVAHKLAAVLDEWRRTEDTEDYYHERAGMALMLDAERTLASLVPTDLRELGRN